MTFMNNVISMIMLFIWNLLGGCVIMDMYYESNRNAGFMSSYFVVLLKCNLIVQENTFTVSKHTT